MKNNRICILQISKTDSHDRLSEFNAVNRAKESQFFDEILLSAPDLQESRSIKKYSKMWEVPLYLGNVDDIAKRFFRILRKYKNASVVRPSIHWFYFDIKLVKKMVLELEKFNADIIFLPKNFDQRFAAEVFSLNFLKKISKIFKNQKIKNKFQFKPWAYAEFFPSKFKTVSFFDLPVYSNAYHNKILNLMKKAWPERRDFSHAPVYSYISASKFIKPDDEVLDIASGIGIGSHYLSKFSKHVIGFDYDLTTVKECKRKYKKTHNLNFIYGNIFRYDFPKAMFDSIVTIHTMEHIEDDEKFLARLRYLLKDTGRLILEVPILADLPFKYTKVPINPFHIREYSVNRLDELISKYFMVKRKWGVNRGLLTDIEKVRNAAFYYAKAK